MELIKLCQQRQADRSYLPKPVEKEKIDYILECCRLAPSACNRQPWMFYVLESDEARSKVKAFYDREWALEAPVLILACINRDEQWVRSSDSKAHGDIDIAIAVEHICLAASEQGLGTCWVCNFDTEAARSQFSIPENLEPAVLIPMGYPASEHREKSRKDISEISAIL